MRPDELTSDQVRNHPWYPAFLVWWEKHKGLDPHPDNFRKLGNLWRRWISKPERAPRITNDRRSYYRKSYLKSEHWKNLKRLMIQKQPFCGCCLCSSHLDVHHRHYRNLYDVTAMDLIVLCRACHAEIHRGHSTRGLALESDVDRKLLVMMCQQARDREFQRKMTDNSLNGLIWRMFRVMRLRSRASGLNLTKMARDRLYKAG